MQRNLVSSREQSLGNQQTAIRKIAVFRALQLGDLLCSVPAFRALRQRFPGAEITLISLPWAADLVRRLPYIDRLAVFPGYQGIAEAPYEPERTEAFLAETRAAGYDLAIQMHGDGSVSNGFVAALGARSSLGYRRGADDRLTTSLLYDPREHEVMRWLRLVNAQLHIEDQKASPNRSHAQSPAAHPILDARFTLLEFPILPEEDTQAAGLLFVPTEAPVIGIHAGASAAARRWPAERFAALADALIERYGADIVLTGSASEKAVTAAVRRAMHHPALDLAGETSLGVFGAAIARLDLLISNDTGAAHMAAAVGTHSVVLFGPGRPEQWAALDRRRQRVIDAWALAGFAGDGAAALQALPVEPVLAACAEILGQTSGRKPAPTQQEFLVNEVGGRSPVVGRRQEA
jgi:ADP-heptose:LPS heptosyltransferase